MPAWLRNDRLEFCLAVIIGVQHRQQVRRRAGFGRAAGSGWCLGRRRQGRRENRCELGRTSLRNIMAKSPNQELVCACRGSV